MDQTVWQEINTYSQDLKVGDQIRVAGKHAIIEKIDRNRRDDLVIQLTLLNPPSKNKSEIMLIMPKTILVTILK